MAVTEIVYADMVPLPERGKFQGLIASYVQYHSFAVSVALTKDHNSVWGIGW